MALSTVMPSPTVTNKCRWSGITTKSWSRNFLAATVGAKHVDHQRGIPFRLQQGAALAGLGGGEERTRLTQDVARKSMACRSCHHQGLKPHSFHGSARLKPCPDTNQIITSCSRKCRNSWQSPAFSRRLRLRGLAQRAKKPPKRRLRARLPAPQSGGAATKKLFPKPGRKEHSSPVLPPRSGARLSFTPFPVLTHWASI